MISTIDEEKLQKNINLYNKIGEIYYPLKANYSKELLDTLIKNGINHFLISSTSHNNLLHSYENIKITHINTVALIDELIYAYNIGVRSFVFDNYEKLYAFINSVKCTYDLEITIKISLSQISQQFIVNTGANKTEQDKIEKYLDSIDCKYGYSIYINNQAKDKYSVKKYIEYILNMHNIKKAEFISIGGLDNLENVHYLNELNGIREEIRQRGIDLRIEPGYHLINNVVKHIFDIQSVHIEDNYIAITIDGTIYNQFFDTALLNREFDFRYIIRNQEKYKLNKQKDTYNKLEIHIFGNSSDSCDYLGKFYLSNKIDINTLYKVEVCNTGAYFYH